MFVSVSTDVQTPGASSHSGRVAGVSIAGYSKAYLEFYKIWFSLSLLVASLALVRFEIIYYFNTH